MAKQLQVTEKAARTAAVVSATGAVACGVCCVLPLALPAVALAGAGGILAWLAGAFVWMTAVAVVAVLGAWGWVWWESARSRARPAASTLYLMTFATTLLAVALLWPLIEPHLSIALRR
jgi:cytochrome bd-type quinol oxidase subunit 2